MRIHSMLFFTTLCCTLPLPALAQQTPLTQAAKDAAPLVQSFDIYRHLFIKLSERCQQPLQIDEVDLAAFKMLVKDKTGTSYLQLLDQLTTPEQIRQDSEQAFQDWITAVPDCQALPFRIQYRSAQLHLKQLAQQLEALPE